MTRTETLESLASSNYALIEKSVAIKIQILDETISADTRRALLEQYTELMFEIATVSAERIRVIHQTTKTPSILSRIANRKK